MRTGFDFLVSLNLLKAPIVYVIFAFGLNSSYTKNWISGLKFGTCDSLYEKEAYMSKISFPLFSNFKGFSIITKISFLRHNSLSTGRNFILGIIVWKKISKCLYLNFCIFTPTHNLNFGPSKSNFIIALFFFLIFVILLIKVRTCGFQSLKMRLKFYQNWQKSKKLIKFQFKQFLP